MKKTTLLASALLLGMFASSPAQAQLSKNKDKFLGNITTRGQVNGGGYEFKSKWNQLTCENETKWSSVQGGGPNSWNWGGADNAYNYCKNNGLLFKFHCLAWGSQYPGWIENLTPEERYKAVVNWMDGVKKRYPDIKMFDVVNEAVQGHQQGTHWFEECLGGKGVSGWDWIINAFELAHERWPDAILIYNDFNTFQWQRQQFIDLCTALRDYGAPIDAYGCQSHDLTGYRLSDFKTAVDQIQNALKMPMYSTEYDIGTDDDNQQLTNYKEQIPYMWEKDYFAGLTLWGSTWGATWTDHGNSGILGRDGKNRPAYDWLVEYMKTDKAINAKSPFPGMKKQVDLYIKPMSPRLSMGEPGKIDLRARMIDKKRKIERIDFYANNKLYCTLTEAPWVVEYTPGKMGSIPLKAVLVADDGQEYTRYGNVQVVSARAPYGSYSMPGTLQAENFDKGVEGSAYHDSDFSNTGGKAYRTDVGVDFATGNNGTVVSNTETGEWMEYTINVREDGLYSFDLTASSGVEGAQVSLSLKTEEGYVDISDTITIPCAKLGSWTKYSTLYSRMTQPLTTGKQIFRLKIVKGGANIDKIQFKKSDVNEELSLDLAISAEKVYENDTLLITAKPASTGAAVKNVIINVDNIKIRTLTEEPFEYGYVCPNYGMHTIDAYVTDENDMVSPLYSTQVMVDKKRLPFKDTYAVIPGDIEAENFDVMGEGFSYHDSDVTDDGNCKYRTDNGGVDIKKANEGYVIFNVVNGEWLDYTVDVQEAGVYNIAMTASTNTDRGTYQLFLMDENGKEKSISLKKNVAAYKNYDNYKTVTATALSEALTVGRHTIRLKFFAPMNVDKFNLSINEEKTEQWLADGIQSAQAGQSTYALYSTDGALLGNFTASAENLNQKALELAGKSGVYVIKNIVSGESKTMMVK